MTADGATLRQMRLPCAPTRHRCCARIRQHHPARGMSLASLAAGFEPRAILRLRQLTSKHRSDGSKMWLAVPEETMTTYVRRANWTEQGMRQVKDSPKRLDKAKEALKQMGGEFKAFYMTMGPYDLVAVYDAPDDAVSARFTLILGMLGNVRTVTLKAFPERAYREIISSLG